MENFNDLTITQLQEKVDLWIKTYGVKYFSELTNMTILTEEVGELARLMSRTYGDQTFKESDQESSIADELADIIWVSVCLANQMNINLNDALAKNFDKKTSRDQSRFIKNDRT